MIYAWWCSYAGSDYTTREESQAQKKIGSRVVYGLHQGLVG